jgi:parallel beta-helix repeat protein
MERYAPDYAGAIRALIDAANHAGGKDNITVVVVASPGYKPQTAEMIAPAARPNAPERAAVRRWPFLVAGLILGLGVGLLIPLVRSQWADGGPVTRVVTADGINAALARARSGDTVVVPAGKYKERVQLREGVTLRAQQPQQVTLISPDGGPAVVARHLQTGSLEGIWIQGYPDAPDSIGIELVDSNAAISWVRITGAQTGIVVRGTSAPLISSSQISNNLGAGIEVWPGSAPRIENNQIAANGNGKPDDPKPGIEVLDQARPLLKDNTIVDNAAEPVWVHGHGGQPSTYQENFFGGLPVKKAIRLVDEPTLNTPNPAKPIASAKKGGISRGP